MVDKWLFDAVALIERMEDNLRELKKQVSKALIQQIDAGDTECIELLARLKEGDNESGTKP